MQKKFKRKQGPYPYITERKKGINVDKEIILSEGIVYALDQ